MSNQHLMTKEKNVKKDGTLKDGAEIVAVAANAWARYRRSGYVFCNTTEANAAFVKQEQARRELEAEAKSENADAAGEKAAERADATAKRKSDDPGDDDDDDDDDVVTMDNTKDEILAYLEANEIEHDPADTKAELLSLLDDEDEE